MTIKTRSLERIEETMGAVDENSLRYAALQSAKSFKSSWIELGRSLYAVWKDKLYKEWGYLTFEAYTAKEIGIKKGTALKLLKSYYFLEREEPAYLEKTTAGGAEPTTMPHYETVNLVRLAKEKEALDKESYEKVREAAFEMGKEPAEIKKDLTVLMKQREELDPDEAREKKRSAVIKRFVSTLKALKTEVEASKILPAGTVKELASFIHKLELELA